MKLYLYNTQDDEIVLNKKLENEKVLDIDFKASCNRLDTQVILNYKKGNFNPDEYNYVGIDFNDIYYFFITNKEFIDNERKIKRKTQGVWASFGGAFVNFQAH